MRGQRLKFRVEFRDKKKATVEVGGYRKVGLAVKAEDGKDVRVEFRLCYRQRLFKLTKLRK